MKKFIAPLAVLAITLLGALSGAPNANAASTYDNVLNQSDLNVNYFVNESCQNTKDFALDWYTYIQSDDFTVYGDETEYGNAEAKQIFRDALEDDGRFFVGKYGNGRVYAYASNSPNVELQFYGDDEFALVATAVDVKIAAMIVHARSDVYYPSGCTEWVQGQTQNSNPISDIAYPLPYYGNGSGGVDVFMNTFPVTYPEGYEGDIISDTGGGGGGIEVPNYSDIVSLSFNVNNKTVEYWGTTVWGDTDMSKIVCRYTLAGVTAGVVTDVVGPCNGEVKTVNVDVYEVYGLRMDVLFDSNGDEFFNPEDDEEIVGTVQRELKIDGQTYSGTSGSSWNEDTRFDGDSCFQDFFPWVNIEGCMAGIGKALSLLSFNTVNLGNNYDTGNGCVALVTLGAWLSIPNQTVCPQIPATIRNIVTPFVTIALALMVIGFITRQKAEDLG